MRLFQLVLVLVTIASAALMARAADQPQWGQRYSRNMVSDETGLPDTFDLKAGANVKWSVSLGTSAYSTPVVAGGRVLVGANNSPDPPRDPRHQGDRGVLVSLNENDGSLAWQLVVPKLKGARVDAGSIGIVSPATVEGNRVYVVTNRNEVMCLDLAGMANGNQGPFRDEGRHQSADPSKPMDVGPLDADILWAYDMDAELGVHQHDAAHGSILVHGPYLYVCTSNGVDNSHVVITSPDAPSLVVLDKTTGRLVATDAERMAPTTIHCTWASPSLGDVGGRTLVFFGGGDGVCYAFNALDPAAAGAAPLRLDRVWRFDCDPSAPKENIHRYQENRQEGPSNITGMPVFYQGRVYVTAGGDYWHGKHQAWLKCIDASHTGDITATGQVWSFPLERHSLSTPSVRDGLVYIADCGPGVLCLDAITGKEYWYHRTKGEMWNSTLVADGKVYFGTQRREFLVMAAGKEEKVLASIDLDSAMNASPVAANGVLYVATMRRLYAIAVKR